MKPGPLPWIVGMLGFLVTAGMLYQWMGRGEHPSAEPSSRETPGARTSATFPGPPPDPRERGLEARVRSPERDPVPDPVPDSLPGFGEYVYVEELPEAIERVAPEYPEPAREQGLEGTVIVQALIGRDGRVVDTRVVRSMSPFDEPAQAAVRRWTFKPARAYGRAVAVWVAVPIRFSLR